MALVSCTLVCLKLFIDCDAGIGGCSKKLLDQDEVSKVAQADSDRGFTPEDVKLMKIQFSSCEFSTYFSLRRPCFIHFQPQCVHLCCFYESDFGSELIRRASGQSAAF